MARFEACYLTHRGYVRENNEDALLLQDIVLCTDSMERPEFVVFDGDYALFAVADGMGGHRGGEIASRLVLEVLSMEKPKSPQEINHTLHRARDRLEDFAKENPFYYGLGCAVAGLVYVSGSLVVFNVGDCRVYGLKDGSAHRLTVDHTEVERLVRRGLIDQRSAKNHPQRHILTSALVGSPNHGEFELFAKPVKKYREFLICSDGLWECLEEEELSLDCDKLIKLALKMGGRDNISYIRLKIT
ncbi:MAG: serine/threonine-protein phosphatase [Acidobacteria bacterium]|jgi:protein phosphatase|nr:MAG: serine/threonine-protein phosphatase [Acidobacteriota bacterium]